MILEFDCGNTRIKWRVRDGRRIIERGVFATFEAFGQIKLSALTLDSIERVLVSSVLSHEYRRTLASWSLEYLDINPEFAVSESSANGVVNGYQQPDRLGVDRWLAILAARSKTLQGFVVIDCGSAITLDIVTSGGEHLGGYIAPGLRLMREALESKTSGIKLSQMGYGDSVFPGRNTISAVKAAELAMITGLVDQARSILGNYDPSVAELWVTGGDGEWLSSMLTNSAFIEDLVLDGLSIALASPAY